MTNGEKYKTPEERAEAFDKFCKNNTTDAGMCMPYCKLFHAQDDSKCYCGHCEFHWLDLDCEEESFESIAKDIRERIMCREPSNSLLPLFDRLVAAHNRVSKSAKDSEAEV